MLGIAALGTLGLGIYGATQGAPASGVALPPPLPGVQQAGSQVDPSIAAVGGYNTYNIPLATDVSMGLFNNPYASAFQGGAGPAGLMGTAGGINAFGAGGNLYGAGTTALDLALDPRSALYNRTVQQLQDQVRTANAAAGVATTPYGAGVEGNVMSNFNIDWQNQQLMRALQGLQGGGAAYGEGQRLQAQAPVQYMAGAGLPYSTFNTIGGNQLGALGGLGQFGGAAAQIPEWMANAYAGYATGGQNANINTANLGLTQANQAFNQTGAIGNTIGWGLAGLGNTGWGGGGGGGPINWLNNMSTGAVPGMPNFATAANPYNPFTGRYGIGG